MPVTIGVVQFPGSNCDSDIVHVCENILGFTTRYLWHKDRDISGVSAIIIPGGFSYGDYLRTGAMAARDPIMDSVEQFAKKGGFVLGICNGFQILCERGMLDGVLIRNKGMRFLSRFVHLRVENTNTPFTHLYTERALFTCPIAHGEGNFYADRDTINKLEAEGRVVLRYVNNWGERADNDPEVNPNGSINSIAGICNKHGNVVGIMPHPERASEALVGHIGDSTGRPFFEGLLRYSIG